MSQQPTDQPEFDRGIAVTDDTAWLDQGWSIGAGINGGYLLAVCAHALAGAVGGAGHPDPVSISGYYLSAATPGTAYLTTQGLRTGRSMATGGVALAQDDGSGERVERVRALATYADLAGLADDVRTTAKPPAMPPLEECVSTDQAPPGFRDTAPLLDRFDLRLDPDCAGWAAHRPSHRGLIQGWLRLADGREPDPLMLLFAVDALPPVTFDLGLPGWAPTLELTVHVRARPSPGWLQVSHSTRNLAGGFFEEDAEVWDSAGRLVAQSRQLAKAPRPR